LIVSAKGSMPASANRSVYRIQSYCGHLFQSGLKAYGTKRSMNRKGDCLDNAPTESLWGSMKRACVYGQRFPTREEAKAAVMNWLEFYNATRLHLRLGCVSPMQFEKNWLAEPARCSAYTHRLWGS
jgi:putative transposase